MQDGDQNAGPVVSALVLIAAAVFTANVYVMYAAEKDIVVYEEAESAYNQAASVMLSLKQAEAEIKARSETMLTESEDATGVDLEEVVAQ